MAEIVAAAIIRRMKFFNEAIVEGNAVLLKEELGANVATVEDELKLNRAPGANVKAIGFRKTTTAIGDSEVLLRHLQVTGFDRFSQGTERGFTTSIIGASC